MNAYGKMVEEIAGNWAVCQTASRNVIMFMMFGSGKMLVISDFSRIFISFNEWNMNNVDKKFFMFLESTEYIK